MNYRHKVVLVDAEIARVLGDDARAMRLYDEAVDGAAAAPVRQRGGARLGARGGLPRGRGPAALRAVLRGARALLLRAMGRRRQGPAARRCASAGSSAPPRPCPGASGASPRSSFDIDSVLKASQAISSGHRVLRPARDPAPDRDGERRRGPGSPAPRGGRQAPDLRRARVRRRGARGPHAPPHRRGGGRRRAAPAAHARPVRRAHARSPSWSAPAGRGRGPGPSFAGERLPRRQEPGLGALAPSSTRGRLVGILYLENRLTRGAFTPQRLEVLRLLSGQAAISITNARLYRTLEEAGRELEKKERQVTQFLEAVPVGVFVTDASGRPVYANTAAQRILGRGVAPDASRERLAEVYQVYVEGTETMYPAEQLPIVKALSGRSAECDDMEVHDGTLRRPLGVTATPILDERGEVQYAIAAFQDITEQKQAQKLRESYSRTLEEQVRERTRAAEAAQRAAEHANQAKSSFLANMSHEVRTPAQRHRRAHQPRPERPTPSPRIADYLRKVRSAPLAARRDQRHPRLLAHRGRQDEPRHGRLRPRASWSSRSTIWWATRRTARASSSSSRFAARRAERGARRPAPPQPGAHQPGLQRGQVHPRGDDPACGCGTLRDGARVRIGFSVSDTGIGIAPEELPRIFHSFTQIDGSTTRRYGGTGLGLTICKHLVELMGGELTAQSQARAGEHLLASRSSSRARAAARAAIPRVPDRRCGARALVVDDNRMACEIVVRDAGVLRDARDRRGRRARRRCATLAEADREDPFALVVLDWKMPGLDGVETARRIEPARRSRCPSSSWPPRTITRASRAGRRGGHRARGDQARQPVARSSTR